MNKQLADAISVVLHPEYRKCMCEESLVVTGVVYRKIGGKQTRCIETAEQNLSVCMCKMKRATNG